MNALSRLRGRVRGWFRSRTPHTSQEFKPAIHDDHTLVLAVTEPERIPHWQKFRLLNRILPSRERRLFWGGVLIAAVSLAFGITNLLRPFISPTPVVGGSFTEALIGTPKRINPLFATLNPGVDDDLTALIYSGLFRVDASFTAQPDLVERYRWLNEGKTLEVTLRGDATFHDGSPVTADDVEFTFQAIKNPNWRSPLASRFKSLSIVRVDDTTLQFQMDRPSPDLLSELTVGILPAHVWEEVSDTHAYLADANIRPIGSGPYQVSSFKRDTNGSILNYKLKRFDDYYGTPPYIEYRYFQFYPDRESAQQALRNHQIDALAFVPWNETETQAFSGNFHLLSLELPQETIAFFNTHDSLLKEQRVREALALAIDQEELKEVYPRGTVVSSPFPFLASATTTVSNLEEARALLTKVGWTLEEGKTIRSLRVPSTSKNTPQASSTQLLLTIDVPDQPDLLRVADLLKRRWSLLGADVTVQSHELDELLRSAKTDRTYQVLVWNVRLSPTQDISDFWESTKAAKGYNFSNLADRQIDQAIEALGQATTTAEIESARTRLSNTITSKTPALFLLRPTYAYIVAKNVRGVDNLRLTQPSDRFLQAMSWYTKTGWRWTPQP